LFSTSYFYHSTLLPGDIIVIDNASFHKSQAIEDLIAQFGCELLYLPPYSPDFNPYAFGGAKPYENWWFVLKNWMKQRWDEFDNFHDCADCLTQMPQKQTERRKE
jgi:hypothetical protein